MLWIMAEKYDRGDWGPQDSELSYFSFGMFIKLNNGQVNDDVYTDKNSSLSDIEVAEQVG